MLVDRPYAMSHNPAYAISHIKHMADVTGQMEIDLFSYFCHEGEMHSLKLTSVKFSWKVFSL